MSSANKRYQVFVSSTYLDLREERQAVTSTLLESDAFPAGMELFPATDDYAWSLIQQVIDESDYYLLVIAGKYGSIDPQYGLSYTEMEYDYAVAQGKPVMAFLHRNIGQLPRDRTETNPDADAKLVAFIEKVQKAKHVKFWDSSYGLAGAVALTFNKFIRSYPAVGWVKADAAASLDVLQSYARAQERIQELESRLDAERREPPAGSGTFAQGHELFDLPALITASYLDEDGNARSVTEYVHVEPSWNALFALIGLKLFDEATTDELRTALEQWMVQEFYSELDTALDEVIVGLGRKRKEGTYYVNRQAALEDDDLGTVLLQFRALGLIRNGTKKRSVADSATYWSLTPFGDTRLVQARAVRRGSKRSSIHDEVAHDVMGPAAGI